MMRKTTTILAVALTVTATTACGGVAAEANPPPTKQELAQELSNTPLEDALKNRDHFAPLCDGDGYPLPGNINPKQSGATVGQFCDAIKPPQAKPDPKPATPPQMGSASKPPPSPPACDKDALNSELSNEPLESALTQAKHFRCLCDDKGYPLVGNINSKGTTASAFCSALKVKGLL